MSHGVTKVLVASIVHSLNEKAERLGWVRRYEFVMGSSANGVQHVLETQLPTLEHPSHRQPIGNTLSKAHQYLAAMGQVLNDAIAEREAARSKAVYDRRPDQLHTTYPDAQVYYQPRRIAHDPDARSLRPGE